MSDMSSSFMVVGFIFYTIIIVCFFAYLAKTVASMKSELKQNPIDGLKRFLIVEDQTKSLANRVANLQGQQQEINKATLALTELCKQSVLDYQKLYFEVDMLKDKEG